MAWCHPTHLLSLPGMGVLSRLENAGSKSFLSVTGFFIWIVAPRPHRPLSIQGSLCGVIHMQHSAAPCSKGACILTRVCLAERIVETGKGLRSVCPFLCLPGCRRRSWLQPTQTRSSPTCCAPRGLPRGWPPSSERVQVNHSLAHLLSTPPPASPAPASAAASLEPNGTDGRPRRHLGKSRLPHPVLG